MAEDTAESGNRKAPQKIKKPAAAATTAGFFHGAPRQKSQREIQPLIGAAAGRIVVTCPSRVKAGRQRRRQLPFFGNGGGRTVSFRCPDTTMGARAPKVHLSLAESMCVFAEGERRS